MASPANHWKLGLFVVSAVVLGLATVVVLGARSLQKDTITYTTFFDESVQGLEIGSPVKFRGVIIGTVEDIDVAPDRRHVRVDAGLVVDDLVQMGLAVGEGKDTQIRVPPDLRAQLAAQGVTGVKFLQIDYFSVESNPPPQLPFPTPENYIPAAVSVLKNLEDSVVNAINRMPEVADQALQIMERINRILGDVESRQFPAKAEDTLAAANQTLGRLNKMLGEVQADKLSVQAQSTLAGIDEAVRKMNTAIDRVMSEQGVMSQAERASSAVGDVARNAQGLGVEVEVTLRAVQDAAASIQRLTDALERDSDMLLKGRAKRDR